MGAPGQNKSGSIFSIAAATVAQYIETKISEIAQTTKESDKVQEFIEDGEGCEEVKKEETEKKHSMKNTKLMNTPSIRKILLISMRASWRGNLSQRQSHPCWRTSRAPTTRRYMCILCGLCSHSRDKPIGHIESYHKDN